MNRNSFLRKEQEMFFSQALVFTFLLFFGVFAYIPYAHAQTIKHAEHPQNEIHYGGVADTLGNEIIIQYRGPSGEENYRCSLGTGECTGGDGSVETTSEYFDGATSITSNDGRYALKISAFRFDSGVTVYYSVYDITGDEPKFKSLVPFYDLAEEKRFSEDGESIIFVTSNGRVVKYNVSEKTKTETNLPGTNLPFWSLSPDGDYASSYDYSEEVHKIYNLNSGAVQKIPANKEGYFEFSDTGTRGAFVTDEGNFNGLKSVDFGVDGAAPKTIASGDYHIEDYIFVTGNLYYMANKENPMNWSIYEYDFEEGSETKIADDVSYGEFMKRQNGKLLYQKIKGKNANIIAYNPETGESVLFEPVGNSSPQEGIIREMIRLENGRYGALLSPEDEENTSGNLFIWLHGGPMRQTSVGYHSYLSYGVYDELLERLAASGAHILKLDYTGSSGYGEELREGLDLKVGVADVEDVVSATKELQDELDIEKTYLIGNSYGGYLALRGLIEGQDDLFDGAISIAGVTDWYGLISRIPSSPFKKLFHGVPGTGDNMSAYREASIYDGIPALNPSEKILMVYGEQDNQVPTWQSIEFIDFADKFDADVESLVFSDEGHILKKRENLNELCKAVSERFDIEDVKCEL